MPEDRIQPSLPEHSVAFPQSASALSDHWYLLAYNVPATKASGGYAGSLSWNWKRIFFVSVIGLVLGVGLAALQLSRHTWSARSVQTELSRPQQAVAVPSAAVLSADAPTQVKRAVLESKSIQAVVKPAPTDAPKAKLTAEEVNRLKARNRRLEALISVLRDRTHAPDKKPAPDQNTVIGQ